MGQMRSAIAMMSYPSIPRTSMVNVTAPPASLSSFQSVMPFHTPNLGQLAPNVLPGMRGVHQAVVAANSHQTHERKVNQSLYYPASSQTKSIFEITQYAKERDNNTRGYAQRGHITFTRRLPNDAAGKVVPTSLAALNMQLRSPNSAFKNVSAVELMEAWK